ncbi:MAG: hypothetical protein HYZ89_03795 [Candidatus Omnitrophica bacterium]|nr:hypothetical protein [Candidatus Omnitrophota bacterium]
MTSAVGVAATRGLDATPRPVAVRAAGHPVAVDATGFSRRPASRDSRLRHGTWQTSDRRWSTLVWTTPPVPHRQYGRRWVAETVFSVVTRQCGDALTARRPWQQVKQAFLRGVVYECYRAVRLGLLLWRWLWHQRVTVAS